MKRLLSASVILLVAACSTSPVPHDHAERVPNDRLLAYQINEPSLIKMTVTRDSGFLGAECFTGLAIEGKLAALFGPSETADFYVPTNTSMMAVVKNPNGRGLCGAGSFDPVIEHYQLRSDGLNLFRISLGQYRRPGLLPAAY